MIDNTQETHHSDSFSDKKKKKWIVSRAKEFWNEYSTSPMFYNERAEATEVMNHMLGRPDTEAMKRELIPKKLANDDKTAMRIDWNPLPIVAKVFRIIHEIANKQSYDIDIQAVDPIALDDREKERARLQSKLIMKKALGDVLSDDSLGIQPNDPQDSEELEMHMKYSYKHRTAYEAESALQLILTDNKYDEDRVQLNQDLIAHGAAIEYDYTDYDGEIKTKYIRYVDFFCEPTNDPYFRDIRMAGHVEEMSVGQIRNLSTSEELASEEYEAVDTLEDDHQRSKEKRKVACIQFLSATDVDYEAVTKADGNVVFGRKTGGKKNKEFVKANYDMLYEVKWVMDTDYYFGAKMATNINRNPRDQKQAFLNYHVVAPKLYNNQAYAWGKQVLSIDKALHRAWFKFQNVIARAKPRGILIEASSMQNVPLGDDRLSPRENLAMYNFSGNLVYRRIDEDGDIAGEIPIKELDNGLKDEAEKWYGVIQSQMQLLRDVSGFNEITDGSTPDPKQLKAVAQLAVQGTNNSLNYIIRGSKKLDEKLCESLLYRIQDAAQDGTIEGYRQALGSTSVDFFKVSKDVSMRELGVFFRDRPSMEEREIQRIRLEKAIDVGQITIGDANWIESIDNIWMQRELLAMRIRKNQEQAQAREERMIQLNSEQQQQSATVSGEQERMTNQEKFSQEMQLVDRKGYWELEKERLRMQGLNMQEDKKSQARDNEARIKSNTDIVKTNIQTESRVNSTKST